MALILVVDDDADIREIIRQHLTDAGHQVLLAENGRAGIELVKQHQPRVLITDIIMPVQEGIETIRQVRQLRLGIKIIAMSGGSPTKGVLYLDAARTLGADATLLKPFRKPDLLVAVNEVLTAV